MTYAEIIKIIAGLSGSLCFGILFNMHGKKLYASAFGGLMASVLSLIMETPVADEPVRYFMISAIISLYSEIIARILKTPATPVITTSLIPLIPGGSLYYTMSYAFESDFNMFVGKASSTLKLASALALGIILVTTVFRVVTTNQCVQRKSIQHNKS